jgi:ABC-type dipeptide/oligopeptide/nickel transport system permease component
MKMNKRAITLDLVPTVVVLLVIIAIVLGLGSTILQNFRSINCVNTPLGYGSTGYYFNSTDQTCRNGTGATNIFVGYGTNATDYGQQGLNTFASFQTTIAIVVVAGVILGIIGAVLLQKKMD